MFGSAACRVYCFRTGGPPLAADSITYNDKHVASV